MKKLHSLALSLALLISSQVPAYSGTALSIIQGQLNKDEQTPVSDPAIDPTEKVSRREGVILEAGRVLNHLQNQLYVLNLQHNHFLGEPLVAEIAPAQSGINDNARYFLVCIQYNVPAVRNIPLNKYRFVRFENMFSIVQSGQRGLDLVYYAQVRLHALERVLKTTSNPKVIAQCSDAAIKAIQLATSGITTFELVPGAPTTLAAARNKLSDAEHNLTGGAPPLPMVAQAAAAADQVLSAVRLDMPTKDQRRYRERAVYQDYKLLDKVRSWAPPNHISVLSIYPTNEFLDADFQNDKQWQARLEPQWMKASSGYVQFTNTDTLKYKLQFPRVVGITNQYGAATWTYYPAKKQPIILGNKTAFVILKVDKDAWPNQTIPLSLRINSRMYYELLFNTPLLGPTVYDEVTVPLLNPTLSVASLLKLRAADLKNDGIKELFETAFAAPPPPEVKLVNAPNGGGNFVTVGDKVYRLEGGKLVQFDFDASPLNSVVQQTPIP